MEPVESEKVDRAVWRRESGVALATVTFTPTADDYAAYSEWKLREQLEYIKSARESSRSSLKPRAVRPVQQLIGTVFGIVCVALLVLPRYTETAKYFVRGALAGVVGLLGIVALYMLVISKTTKNYTAREANLDAVNRGLIDVDMNARTLELSHEGVACSTASKQFWVCWSEVRGISEFEDLVFVHVTGEQIIIVPKRAFLKVTDADQFIQVVKARMRRQPGESAAPPTVALPRVQPMSDSVSI